MVRGRGRRNVGRGIESHASGRGNTGSAGGRIGHPSGAGGSGLPLPETHTPASRPGTSGVGRGFPVDTPIFGHDEEVDVPELPIFVPSTYDATTATAHSGSDTPDEQPHSPIPETPYAQQGVSASTAASTSQPHRRLTVTASGLYPSSKCAQKITAAFQTLVDGTGYDWKHVTLPTKEHYWREFKKSFFWDPALDAAVRVAYNQKAAERYRQYLATMRRNFRLNGKKPSCVPEHIWNEWQIKWLDPKFVTKSKQNTKNRLSSEDGVGPSVHSGGSISTPEIASRLEEGLRRKPNAGEIYLYSHTKNHDGKTFIDQRSKKVHDEIQRLRVLRSQPSEGSSEPVEIDENQIYYDAVGGEKKQRVYGLGSMARSIYNVGGSSAPTASPSVDPSIVDQQLQNIRDQMSSLEEARIRDTQRHWEEMEARDQKHQQELETLGKSHQEEITSLHQQLQSQREITQQLQEQFQQSLVFQQQMQQLLSSGMLPVPPSAPPPPPHPSNDSPES